MIAVPEIDKHDIEEKLAKASWYHRYELLPGIFTPGLSDFAPKAVLDELGVPADLSGTQVLDIGTWDGPVAFELERRGARVTALDIQDPDNTGFNTARAILESKVEYVRGSIYDLSRLLTTKYDHVFCLGVFYHLKHPVLAFEEIAHIMREDARLYFEGECLLNYAELLTGEPSTLDIASLAESDVPLTLCYPGEYKGAPNWFVPNFACLKSWLKANGLEVVSHKFWGEHPGQRVRGVAKKSAEGGIVLEHPIFPRHWH
jgi:SAM-dependent methyltransferase